MRAIVLTLALAGVSMAANASAPGEATLPSVDSIDVEFRVENAEGEATRHFESGETAHFVFRLRNTGDEPARLAWTFPPHKVAVLSGNAGETVWRSHHGRMFAQVMQAQEIAPGEAVTFTAEWDFGYAGKPGAHVPAGEYRVQPSFTAFQQPGNASVSSGLEPTTITLGDSAQPATGGNGDE